MSYYPEFAKLLNHYLTEQDRSASWLAKRLGVARQTVSRWLSDETRPDSTRTVIRMADILGINDPLKRKELVEAAGYPVIVIYLPSDNVNKEPSALIIKVEPKVEVVPVGMKKRDAKFGMYLQQGDRVMTFENAQVSILCKKGFRVSLFENRNWTVNCRPEMEESIQDSPIIIAPLDNDATDGGSSLNWPRSGKRGRSRSKQANMPLLLTPRNTLIANPRPTFRWEPVEGASGYRIRLMMPGGKAWLRETNETYLPYPNDEPALSSGDKQHLVILTTLDNPRTSDKSWLRVMNESTLAELTQATAALQTLEVDEAAKRYFLAQLYQKFELHSAAIRELVHLTETEENISANLWQQLGDLYSEVQLYAQAEKSYQTVLTTTEANLDKRIQAAAVTGLARIAYSLGNKAPALDWLNTAETLYREIGDYERANLMAAQKSNLSSN